MSYETVRQWCLKFGQTYANELRRHRPRVATHGTWMRVYLKINGKTHYLWRAVDQDGNVLGIRVAEPTQQKGGQKIFSEAPQRVAIRPARNYHRQLATHTVLDLLPDRNAESAATWMREHPEIEVVSRDRGRRICLCCCR